MSAVYYCDEDDCWTNGEEDKVYDVSWDKQNLKDICKGTHICKSCVEMINEEYEEEYPLIKEVELYEIELNKDNRPRED